MSLLHLTLNLPSDGHEDTSDWNYGVRGGVGLTLLTMQVRKGIGLGVLGAGPVGQREIKPKKCQPGFKSVEPFSRLDRFL